MLISPIFKESFLKSLYPSWASSPCTEHNYGLNPMNPHRPLTSIKWIYRGKAEGKDDTFHQRKSFFMSPVFPFSLSAKMHKAMWHFKHQRLQPRDTEKEISFMGDWEFMNFPGRHLATVISMNSVLLCIRNKSLWMWHNRAMNVSVRASHWGRKKIEGRRVWGQTVWNKGTGEPVKNTMCTMIKRTSTERNVNEGLENHRGAWIKEKK